MYKKKTIVVLWLAENYNDTTSLLLVFIKFCYVFIVIKNSYSLCYEYICREKMKL